MRVSLIIASGKKASLSVKIKPGVSLIGRSASCQVRPKTSSVGKRHCAIICTEDDVWIEDLNSKTGTKLNREPITERVRLKDGDRIRTGKVKYTFLIKEHAPSWAQVEQAKLATVGADESGPSITPEPFDEMDLGTLLMELDEADRQERIDNIKEDNRRKEQQRQIEMEQETWFEEEDTPSEDSHDIAIGENSGLFDNENQTKTAAAKGLRQIVSGVIEEEEVKINRDLSKTPEDLPQGLGVGPDGKPLDKKAAKKAEKAAKAARKKIKKAKKAKSGPGVLGGAAKRLQEGGSMDFVYIGAIVLVVIFGGLYVYRNMTHDPAEQHALFQE